MAVQIGKALAKINETDSSAQSIAGWEGIDLSVLNALPARLDDVTLTKVEAIARLPVPELPRCDEEFFHECMRTLKLLPGRGDDELKGELRRSIFELHLGSYSRQAINFLVWHATRNFRFFPSVAECIAVLDTFVRKDRVYRASQIARAAATKERRARFDDAMERLRARSMPQEEVDQLSERWLRIAEERGYVRLTDGKYIIRREPDHA